ncbi:MAG: respiratory nitrate reductase subunit gamma [Anaerolineales bacterium]
MHTIFQSFSVIPAQWRWLFSSLGWAALLIFTLGTLSRISLWLSGTDKKSGPLEGKGLIGAIWLVIVQPFSIDCLFARRVFARSKLRGVMLMLTTWSFIILLLGVLNSLLELFFQPALAMDIAGGLLLAGLSIAVVKRFVFPSVHAISLPADSVVLVLFWAVVVLGFLLEGVNLAPLGWSEAATYPVGSAFGQAVAALTPGDPTRAYRLLYVLHGGGGFMLIGYLPFSKLFHMLAAQITTLAARQRLSQTRGAA